MKKTNKNKIACVVGSGASSYALLHRLVKQKKYSKIYVVTTGSYKETFTLNNPSSSISENIQNKMFSLIPEKLLFGNNRIYKRTDAQELYLEGYSIKTSHQFSGLVNIWGANVCFPTENDIKKYPNLLAYIPYFNSVANILKVSGDSSWVSGKGNFSKSFELVRSSRANEFNHSCKKIHTKDFRSGSSILAVNSEIGDEEACRPCGKCLDGCERGAIFNLYREYSNFLKNNSNKVELIDNSKVCKINFYSKKFDVYYKKNSSKKNLSLKCENVFLTAGVFDNALILLKSNFFYEKKLKVLDSNKYYFLALRSKYSSIKSEDNLGSLSESFFQFDTSYGTIHSQLYPSTKLLTTLLGKFGFIKILAGFFSIGMIYLPSALSNEIEAQLSDDGQLYLKTSKRNFVLRFFYLIKLIYKTWLNLIPHGLFIIPYLKSCPAGNSQHSGSFLYNKKLIPKGLYLADTSGLCYIPGTPTTALAMAHAMHIGDHHE